MKLNRIKIKNIRSYENAEIVFPTGSVLLSGDIGSGKSTILLAIEFAFFGLQPGQKGSSLLKNGKDYGVIEMEFEVEEKKIVLTRSLKRKKSIVQDSSFITIDGVTTEKSVTELKNEVLKIINYPLEFSKKTNLLYRFTVYTPQEEMKQIILENPETRVNTLRHIFGINKYKRIKENSVILLQKIKELLKLKQGQIMDLDVTKDSLRLKKEDLSTIKKQIPDLKLKIRELNKIKDEKKKELEDIRKKIDEKNNLEREIEKNNLLILTKKEQLAKTKKEIDEINLSLKEAEKNFDKERLEKVVEEIDSKKISLEDLEKKIMEFSTQIYSLELKKKDFDFLKDKISHLKNCPTCLQEVSQEHKDKIMDETNKKLSEINNEKIELDNEKQKTEIKTIDIESRLKELEEDKGVLEKSRIIFENMEREIKKIEELEKNKNFLEKDIAILQEQEKTLKDSIFEMRKFDNLFSIKEKEVAEILVEERSWEIKNAEIIKEIDLTRNQIKELELSIKNKLNIKKQIEYLSQLEEWISGRFLDMIGFIEKNVMIKLRMEFSKLFSDWFSMLVPENFVVRLDEDFTPVIEQQGFEIDYFYLSGGEKTAIALAYRLALNQTINSILSEINTKGLVILDEPTDGFSQQQLDKMRDVLQQLDVEQLVIVSHDQKIESFVDHIIRLKKEEGVTKIV